MKLRVQHTQGLPHNGLVHSVSWSTSTKTSSATDQKSGFAISVGDDKSLQQWLADPSAGANALNPVNTSLSPPFASTMSPVGAAPTNQQFAPYLQKELCQLNQYCVCCAFCPFESFLAMGFVDGSLRFLNVANNKVKMQNTSTSQGSLLKSKNTIGSIGGSAAQPTEATAKIIYDKHIENAHHGAVSCLSWNSDGTELITGGEDGVIKQWSSSGHLRSKLCQCAHPVYATVWTHNDQSIVYAAGKTIGVQPLQTTHGAKSFGQKSIKWNAHESTILCLDWNEMNQLIVSGSEDCHYRIWDQFGRLIYSSQVLNYPVTQVQWSNNGKYFVVGSNNCVLFCDYLGWVYNRVNLENSGSILAIDWTQDSNQICLGSANGQIMFGIIVEKQVLYRNYHVMLNHLNQIIIRDISETSDAMHSLYEIIDDINDNIVDFSVNFDYIIVVTTKQCHIYHLASINTPQIISLPGGGGVVYHICQTSSYFILVSSAKGINVMQYQGRSTAEIRVPGLKAQCINERTLSATDESIAFVDGTDRRKIHFFDASTGRELAEPYEHNCEVLHVSLATPSSLNAGTSMKFAFIDNNKDLFLSKIDNAAATYENTPFKLSTIVDSIMWHPNNEMLFALSDKSLVVWYYPSMIWCDADLLKDSCVKLSASHIGSNANIVSIHGSLVTIRKANGIKEIMTVSVLPILMYDAISSQGAWNAAVRLCHAVKEPALWCLMTGLALDNNQIDCALQALTELEEPDKLLFLKRTANLPIKAHREAEIALYRRNIAAAEQILLSNQLIYRAIELNIRLFRWQRALELAIKYGSHIDTVIAFRNKYLEANELQETSELFKEQSLRVGDIDFGSIDTARKQEIDKEFQKENIKPRKIYDYLYNLSPEQESNKMTLKEVLENIKG